MASSPLQGIELLDCAQSDPTQDITLAAQRCGYGDDLVMFEEELKKAAIAIGIHVDSFEGLKALARTNFQTGLNIAPGTTGLL